MAVSKSDSETGAGPAKPPAADRQGDLQAAAIELLPIPAAMVAVDDGSVRVEHVNEAFQHGRLAEAIQRSPLAALLGERISRFMASSRTAEDFTWPLNDAETDRRFLVALARSRNDPQRTCLVTLVDLTPTKSAEHGLRQEMLTDRLTGLPNRRGFCEQLQTLLDGGDAAPATQCAVVVVDLDRFSRVNACLGTSAGDELLITVARRLKGALRARDTLARIAGDEFGILLALDEGREEATLAAQRIQAVLATPFQLSNLKFSVSCSIGIAFSKDAEGDAAVLIRHAQFAVKRAKVSGASEVYQKRAFVVAREQFAIETALRRAIDDDALILKFQPIIDLATGKVVAFEALTRWIDEHGEIRNPAEFIPIAEESGLIVPLGRWAIKHAAQTLAAWDRQAGGSCGVGVAVNISAIQIQRDTIAPIIERVLTANRLQGGRLTLELTEGALITDPDRVAATLNALRAIGTILAMDDFGTGYSNLAHLQKLPIDVLKIDRAFVTDMLGDRDKLAIVRAILSMAQTLGMRTTAEGIETAELGRTLAALGCTYGQGFAYSRALDADAAFAYLLERNQSATR